MLNITEKTQRLLELLGHDETPFGVHYDDIKPEGFGPKPGELFTREREDAGLIDWQNSWKTFSCIMGNIWLARKKKKAAWISHEECGCMGGGFQTGLYRPYLNFNVIYVSTGIPEANIEGEHFMPSQESMRAYMDDTSPPVASGKYCIFKPLDQFTDAALPLAVIFFARPEVLNGLFSLTMYATGDHNSVVTPFAPGCGGIMAWPIVYQQRGLERAVLAGFDISARKFMKTDELSFAVPLSLYQKMLDVMEKSALTRHAWQEGTRKKAIKSANTWAGSL
jgi:hypothetical protein